MGPSQSVAAPDKKSSQNFRFFVKIEAHLQSQLQIEDNVKPGFEPVPFVAPPPSSLALNSNFGEALISAQVLTVFFVVKVIRQIKNHLAVH